MVLTFGIASGRKYGITLVEGRKVIVFMDNYFQTQLVDWANGSHFKYEGGAIYTNGQNEWCSYQHPSQGKVHCISRVDDGFHHVDFLVSGPSLRDCQAVTGLMAIVLESKSYEIQRRGIVMPLEFQKIVARELFSKPLKED